MCLFIGLGVVFIAGGVNVVIQGNVPFGLVVCAMGLWIFFMGVDLGRSGGIDVSVRNKVVAHDGNGRWLVEADTSRQITGPRPHVNGNLPAGLYKVEDGLWIVDSTGTRPPNHIDWQPMSGYRIEPRGNTETGGFLHDLMEGYDHNYIVEDK